MREGPNFGERNEKANASDPTKRNHMEHMGDSLPPSGVIECIKESTEKPLKSSDKECENGGASLADIEIALLSAIHVFGHSDKEKESTAGS